MNQKFKQLLWTAGADPEDYKRIEDEVWRENRKNVRTFCFVVLVLLTSLSFVSHDGYYYGDSFHIFYIMDAVISAVMILLLTFLSQKKILVKIWVAFTYILAYGSAIYIGTYLDPNSSSVTVMVFLALLPQMVNVRPITMILTNASAVGVYLFFCQMYSSSDVMLGNEINALAFGVLSICFAFFTMRNNTARYVNEYKLRYLGDVDLLTGVNNRNLYERKLKQYEELSKNNLCVVYIDVNGLHEMNNTQGHQCGDEALRAVADELKQNFRQSDIYRIGGDEFVVFIVDQPLPVIVDRVENCQKNLLEEEVYISYGAKEMKKPELKISGLIKDAERKMFEAKEDFYQSHGLVHR